MKTGDYILIGNGIEEEKMDENLLKYFEDKEWNEFLIKILVQLGFKRDDVKLKTRFRHSRIEWYYKINTDREISLGNKSISIKKGDEIIVAVSYHYTLKEFEDYLKIYFEEIDIKVSEDKKYILALCKK